MDDNSIRVKRNFYVMKKHGYRLQSKLMGQRYLSDIFINGSSLSVSRLEFTRVHNKRDID